LSEKWALLKAVQREPDNPLPCYALADLLEEEGWTELSFAYRRMGWYGRRPGYREGKFLRKRFAWYREDAFEAWPGGEADGYNALPRARPQPLVSQAREANPQFRQLATIKALLVQAGRLPRRPGRGGVAVAPGGLVAKRKGASGR
jgi:hypothetical protein